MVSSCEYFVLWTVICPTKLNENLHRKYLDSVLGIMAIADTIKDDAKIAVDELRRMGLKVVMLTGDNIRTAKAIAKEVYIFISEFGMLSSCTMTDIIYKS